MMDVSRRGLIVGAVGAGVMFALGGVAKVAVGSQPLLRPPGGQDEATFIGNCIKCDRCRSACPQNVIGVANISDGLLGARSPKMDFRKGYCDFCKSVHSNRGDDDRNNNERTAGEESKGANKSHADALKGSTESKAAYDTGLLCALNCPTGAIAKFNHNTQRIGLAVVDPEQCIAFAKLGGCKVCSDKCPFEAINLDSAMRPIVQENMCNGCGYCEFVCPSHSYRAFSGSPNRGINILWVEGERP